MQKGALDKYIQLDVQQQIQTSERIEKHLKRKKPVRDLSGLISLTDQVLAHETPAMIQLRAEALRLGEESNALFGTRTEAIFNLDHDYIGLGWTKRQLQRAQNTLLPEEKHELLGMITDYEGKSQHALYDNLGTGKAAPQVTYGYPYDHGQPYVASMLSESNRPSQRSMHFTQDESQGVTLLYKNLTAGQHYRLRLCLVRPVYQDRYLSRMKQHRQSVSANGHLLGDTIEIPEHMSDFITFDIPANLIRKGELEIRLMNHTPDLPVGRIATEQWRNTGGWGTLLSEAWLIPSER